jgi:GNAT superfamily N-acetyltransferase
MSLYAEYWEEEEDKKVIESENGFVAYQHIPSNREFFITDMFIKKEVRGTGLGQLLGGMAEELAKDLGCKKMTCNVWVKEPVKTTRKIRIFNEFGFNIISCGNGYITMMKEI